MENKKEDECIEVEYTEEENAVSDAYFSGYTSGVEEGSEEGFEAGYLEGHACGIKQVKLEADEYYEGYDDGMTDGQKFAEAKLGTMGGMVELIKKRIGNNSLLFERFLKHLDKQFEGKIGLKTE
ncbi:MAG TPA: hypothetical protein VMX17_03455 [Candidatus Glassbacteria bacterium]|nr:hypothetical protein [Candidatus Glassbacteria bacterium]